MIILASNSKLRKLIFESSGLPFEVKTKEVDERAIEDQNPDKNAAEIVEILAIAKAKAVADDNPGRFVVAADTFGVLSSGERLHKTKTLEDSIQLALKQSGQTITVHTGVAVVYQGKISTAKTQTKILYTNFDEGTVRRLFELKLSEDRRNSALGFFIDAPGFTLVESVEGSYLGAMGLPMEVVRKSLAEVGYKVDEH